MNAADERWRREQGRKRSERARKQNVQRDGEMVPIQSMSDAINMEKEDGRDPVHRDGETLVIRKLHTTAGALDQRPMCDDGLNRLRHEEKYASHGSTTLQSRNVSGNVTDEDGMLTLRGTFLATTALIRIFPL